MEFNLTGFRWSYFLLGSLNRSGWFPPVQWSIQRSYSQIRKHWPTLLNYVSNLKIRISTRINKTIKRHIWRLCMRQMMMHRYEYIAPNHVTSIYIWIYCPIWWQTYLKMRILKEKKIMWFSPWKTYYEDFVF